MTLVVDSSIAVSWGLPDESSVAALAALHMAGKTRVVVPSLFWHEVRNVFIVNERRGRCGEDDTAVGLALVRSIRPGVDTEAEDVEILSLARAHSITAYDASYLELAIRLDATLATNDRRLAEAAQAAGCKLISDV